MEKKNTVIVVNENGVKAVRAMTQRINPDSSITHFKENATVIILSKELSRRKRVTVGKIIYKPKEPNPELFQLVTNAIKYSGLGY